MEKLHFGLICFQKLILKRCNGWRQRGAQENDVNTCKVWKNGLTSGRAGAGSSHRSSTKKLFLWTSRVVSFCVCSRCAPAAGMTRLLSDGRTHCFKQQGEEEEEGTPDLGTHGHCLQRLPSPGGEDSSSAFNQGAL